MWKVLHIRWNAVRAYWEWGDWTTDTKDKGELSLSPRGNPGKGQWGDEAQQVWRQLEVTQTRLLVRDTMPLLASDMGKGTESVLPHYFFLPQGLTYEILSIPPPPRGTLEVSPVLKLKLVSHCIFVHMVSMNVDNLSSWTKYGLAHSLRLHLRYCLFTHIWGQRRYYFPYG